MTPLEEQIVRTNGVGVVHSSAKVFHFLDAMLVGKFEQKKFGDL